MPYILDEIKEGKKSKFHDIFPGDEKRLINEQINDYKKSTELAKKELDAIKDQKDAEKRKINEKQIRALRGRYRSSGGFLNNQAQQTNATETGLPTKLGV